MGPPAASAAPPHQQWAEPLTGHRTRYDTSPAPLAHDKALPCPDLLACAPPHTHVLLIEPPDPLSLIASIANAPATVTRADVVIYHSFAPSLARTALLLLAAEGASDELIWELWANAVWEDGDACWEQAKLFAARLCDSR